MGETTQPYDPDERRHEAMMDGSGFSNFSADARQSSETFSAAVEPPRFARPDRKPRPTGNVRDFETDRDHELAAERANYEELTEEQLEERRTASKNGRVAIEAALDDAFGKDRHIKAIEAKVERMIPIDPDRVQESLAARERQVNALLRKHFEDKEAS